MGLNERYCVEVERLGIFLAKNNIALIYGGSNLGLMGVLANSVLDHGGAVTAIITKDLLERCGHSNKANLMVVDTLPDRKKEMSRLADAFAALPGGFGTLDEMFEVMTEGQLEYHKKPCAFFNIDGFYNGLVEHFSFLLSQGFISKEDWERFSFCLSVEGLVSKLGL
jgi:uncharacterized protein (TIGR00730 family)